MENIEAQDKMESGVEQIKTNKKWKIPRVNSAPTCYSMYEWAFRLSLSDMIIGAGLAFLFFWLTTQTDSSDEGYEGVQIMLSIFGVIFCIVFCFGLLLCIGLWSINKFKKLLRVYCWYAVVLAVIVFLLFFASAIFIMVNSGDIGLGFGAILIAILLAVYELYVACLINSIYMNVIEGHEELNLKKNGC